MVSYARVQIPLLSTVSHSDFCPAPAETYDHILNKGAVCHSTSRRVASSLTRKVSYIVLPTY